jgi:hypothetical protein
MKASMGLAHLADRFPPTPSDIQEVRAGLAPAIGQLTSVVWARLWLTETIRASNVIMAMKYFLGID